MDQKPRYTHWQEGRTSYTGWVYVAPKDAQRAGLFQNLKTTLGKDTETAWAEAERRNEILDQWRALSRPKTGVVIGDGTVRHLAKAYEESRYFKKLAPKTRQDYDGVIRRALSVRVGDGRELGDVKVNDVSRQMAEEVYEAYLDRGERSAAYVVSVMRRMFKIGRNKLRMVHVENPWTEMEIESGPPRDTVWTYDQIMTFKETADRLQYPSIGLIAYICFDCAQRHVDVRRLTWDDYVDTPKGKKLVFKQSKRGATVVASVSPELEVMLAEARERQPEFICGHDLTQEPWNEHLFRKKARDIRRAAGLPDDLWIGDLRRTGATEADEAGVDPYVGMALTGHQDLKTYTSVYARGNASRADAAQQARWRFRNQIRAVS